MILIIWTFQQQAQSQPQPFQFVQPQNNSQNVEEDEFDEFVGPNTVGSRLASFQVRIFTKIQGVPHLRSFHYHRSHYHGFWLKYVQVGDFCISRGPPTVPLTRISCNTVFESPKMSVRQDPLY